MDKESDIEQYFVTQVRRHGGWPIKLTSQGTAGLPDRLVLWPGGLISFVELKRPGGKPRPLQDRMIDRIRGMDFTVVIVSTRVDVDVYIKVFGGDVQ